MKIIGSSLFRALCAIAIGILLLRTPDSTVTWITVAIGALFFISGAISCLDYLYKLRQYRTTRTIDANGKETGRPRPFLPIVGIGSMLLGLLLALTPTAFISSLMYVLAAVVILGALSQMYALITARKYGPISFAYWLLPILLLLAGIFTIARPMAVAATPLVIIGVCLIVYGVSECINSFVIYRKRKKSIQSLPIDEGEYVEYTEESSTDGDISEIKDKDKDKHLPRQ